MRPQLLALAAVVASFATTASGQNIIYVDDSAPPGGDGASWASAFAELQDAIALATPADQIWVAQGTYRPDRSTGNRSDTFNLAPGRVVIGGFVGVETDVAQRPTPLAPTILSGEIGDPNTTADNSLHVVSKRNPFNPATLDGFIITGGNASATTYPDGFGGGLISEGPMTVVNCTIEGNTADSAAGLSSRTGPLTLENSVIRNNTAARDGGGAEVRDAGLIVGTIFSGNTASLAGALNLAGAIRVDSSVFRTNFANTGGAIRTTSGGAIISRSLFQSNNAATGGAMHVGGGAVITHSRFISNSAGDGGAINCVGSASILSCELTRNFASNLGGAVNIVALNQTVWIRNVTIARNNAGTFCGGVNIAQGAAVIANTIVWGNLDGANNTPQDEQLRGNPANFTVRNSIVQAWSGTIAGNTNRSVDPRFIDPDGPDDIAGTLDDDFDLRSGSPAIDWGDNTDAPLDVADLDNDAVAAAPAPVDRLLRPRFTDNDPPSPPQIGLAPIDLGALEFQPPPILPGDANRDGAVTFADITAVLANFGAAWVIEDVTLDGVVSFTDITMVLSTFGSVQAPSPALQ
jgi:predicted outer membrane repeat protein